MLVMNGKRVSNYIYSISAPKVVTSCTSSIELLDKLYFLRYSNDAQDFQRVNAIMKIVMLCPCSWLRKKLLTRADWAREMWI